MYKIYRTSKVVLICCLCIISATKLSAQKPVHKPIIVTIDPSKQGDKIERLIYGQFIELLFNYFEGGLWAEMLGDRKFFYPISKTSSQSPVNTRNYLGTWKPIGDERKIIFDSQKVFVGDHSPKIILSNNELRGISQTGLSLQKDSSYTGRIILAADQDPMITVSIHWPGGEKILFENKQNLSKNFSTIPFQFTSPQSTSDAVFTVTAKGNGSIWIGAASLMPANNINGFRQDILAQYKLMNLGNFRWGGNASSGYDWRNGIGDRDQRPPVYDYAWNAMESNDVGTDEYLQLCSLLNTEPHIGVNAGFGDATSAAAWLEYVNGNAATPMGKWRAANGHPGPYKVKWWGIGNEMYGKWQLGTMSAYHYAIKHNLFAAAMKKVDSSIILVASGATPFEMGCTSIYSSDYKHDTLPFAIGGKYDWSGYLIANSGHHFNYLAEHAYPLGDSAFDEKLQRFISVKDDALADKVRRMPNRLKGSMEAFRQYQKKYPVLKEKNITLALDEWRMKDAGYGMKDALATAEGYHEIFRHTDIVKMSTYTSTDAPGGLLYNDTSAALQPGGLVISLLSNFFGTIPVAVTGSNPQPAVKGTIGVDRPVVSSGSATYPLDIAAALKTGKNGLTVSVVNPTAESQPIEFKFTNAFFQLVNRRVIAGKTPNDFNQPGKEPVVSIRTLAPSKRTGGNLFVQPFSITLFEFDAKQ
ncbi:MAG: alpha-N-arabinofuranosidase [Bacteroidota bacterium]